MASKWIAALTLFVSFNLWAAPVNDAQLYERLSQEWHTLIRGSFTAKEAYRFIEEHKTPIIVTADMGGSLRGSFYAVFNNNKILVNQLLIDDALEELSGQGLSGRNREEILAKKTVDLIIHELMHAQLEEEMHRELGFRLTLPLQEDELLAYHAQARALTEFQDIFMITDVKISALLDMQIQLFRAGFNGGCNAIIDYINQWNPVLSILAPQSEVLKQLNDYLTPIERSLSRLEARLKDLKAGAEPSDGLTREEEIVKLETTRAAMLENKKIIQESVATLSDADKFLALTNFYRTRIGQKLSCTASYESTPAL